MLSQKRLYMSAAVIALTITASLGWMTPRAMGAESDPGPIMLTQAESSEPVATRTEITTTETVEESSNPLSFSLGYAIYTDYIFRGRNFSEFVGEGREKLNHQLSANLGFDLSALNMGDLGTIGLGLWFEWYAAQKQIDPVYGGQNLQEVDYIVNWTYTLEPIATDLTLGYVYYQFPNLAYALRQDGDPGNNNDDRTQEYYVQLAHNDAWLWKSLFPDNEDGVLNPSFLFVHDFGALPGVWMELGLSHEFAIPNVDGLTVKPSYTLMIDGDYWTDSFCLAGDKWGVAATYDLAPVLQLPDWAGSVTIGADLYYYNAYGNNAKLPFINDEFWGGVNIGWSWGG